MKFRDGNVPAGSGNRRVVEKALAALPGGIDKIYLRGDSALYEHDLMRWLDERAIGYAISADMSPQLADCIAGLTEDHWKPDQPEVDAIREWAEVNYLPSDGIWKKDAVSPRRYLAIRIRPRQGELLRDGNRLRHFCIVTNRSDPLAPAEGWHHRACPRRADERTRGRRAAQSEVRRQRRLAAPQRDPLQPAVRIQARRLTRGIAHRTAQAATLLAAQHRR